MSIWENCYILISSSGEMHPEFTKPWKSCSSPSSASSSSTQDLCSKSYKYSPVSMDHTFTLWSQEPVTIVEEGKRGEKGSYCKARMTLVWACSGMSPAPLLRPKTRVRVPMPISLLCGWGSLSNQGFPCPLNIGGVNQTIPQANLVLQTHYLCHPPWAYHQR